MGKKAYSKKKENNNSNSNNKTQTSSDCALSESAQGTNSERENESKMLFTHHVRMYVNILVMHVSQMLIVKVSTDGNNNIHRGGQAAYNFEVYSELLT